MDEDEYEYYENDEYMLPMTNPADVAVLPCGHVFHDQCLQFISPQDLSSEHQCCSEFLSSMMWMKILIGLLLLDHFLGLGFAHTYEEKRDKRDLAIFGMGILHYEDHAAVLECL